MMLSTRGHLRSPTLSGERCEMPSSTIAEIHFIGYIVFLGRLLGPFQMLLQMLAG